MAGFPGVTGGVKSPTNINDTQTRAATGQAYASGQSEAISGFQLQDAASVTLTDLGAVRAAFGFSEDALKGVLAANSAAQLSVANAFKGAQAATTGLTAVSLAKLGLGVIAMLIAAGVFLGVKK